MNIKNEHKAYEEDRRVKYHEERKLPIKKNQNLCVFVCNIIKKKGKRTY